MGSRGNAGQLLQELTAERGTAPLHRVFAGFLQAVLKFKFLGSRGNDPSNQKADEEADRHANEDQSDKDSIDQTTTT